MTQINGGLVRHEKTVSRGDFQPEKAVVELTFSVDENDSYESILDRAIDIATAKVGSILNGKPNKAPAPAAAPAKAEGGTKADLEARAREEAGAAPRGRGRPPKPAADKPAGGAPSGGPAPAGDEWGADVAGAAETKGGGEDWGAEPEQPKALSDAELLEAITKHNAQVQNPVAIRKLIGKFTGGEAGKRANDIPAGQRATFVKELHEIKPLA